MSSAGCSRSRLEYRRAIEQREAHSGCHSRSCQGDHVAAAHRAKLHSEGKLHLAIYAGVSQGEVQRARDLLVSRRNCKVSMGAVPRDWGVTWSMTSSLLFLRSHDVSEMDQKHPSCPVRAPVAPPHFRQAQVCLLSTIRALIPAVGVYVVVLW
jgi:hypothetical protein